MEEKGYIALGVALSLRRGACDMRSQEGEASAWSRWSDTDPALLVGSAMTPTQLAVYPVYKQVEHNRAHVEAMARVAAAQRDAGGWYAFEAPRAAIVWHVGDLHALFV